MHCTQYVQTFCLVIKIIKSFAIPDQKIFKKFLFSIAALQRIIHPANIVIVAGTEMIAGGTRTRTLVMYMVVLGLNAPVGVAIGE